MEPEDDEDSASGRRIMTIAGIVAGVLLFGGLLGWVGGKLLIRQPQTVTAAVAPQQQQRPAPPQPAPAVNPASQNLLGLPPLSVPGQKTLTDTLGNQPAPPSPAPAPPPVDTTPSYGPSNSSGIVLLGPNNPPPAPPASAPPVPAIRESLGAPSTTPTPAPKPEPPKPAPAKPVVVVQQPPPPPVHPAPRAVEVAAKPAEKPVRLRAAKHGKSKPAAGRHVARLAKKSAPAPAQAGQGRWIVQLGVFRAPGNAQDLMTRLAKKGEMAQLGHRNEMIVVYTNAESPGAARAAAKRLSSKGFPTYILPPR